jgi:tryptophanase
MASRSSEPCRQANGGKTGFNALAQRIKAALHAADALKQPGIHQRGNGFAVFVDDDAVLPVLHLVEHFAQVLSESDGAGLGDHGGLAG